LDGFRDGASEDEVVECFSRGAAFFDFFDFFDLSTSASLFAFGRASAVFGSALLVSAAFLGFLSLGFPAVSASPF
jgi:hypothetical protein